MRRRFFQRLQQAVESLIGKHVHFVDDIDLVARRYRAITHLLDDLAYVVNASMRGGVHLDHIDMTAFHDRLTVFALHGKVDGRLVNRICLVIERARQNARRGGLTDPAHTGEHPGLRNAACLERVPERTNHRLLADKIIEILGTIFAGENAIGAIGGFRVHELPFRSAFASFPAPVWTGRMSGVNQRGCPSTVVGVVRKGGRLAR